MNLSTINMPGRHVAIISYANEEVRVGPFPTEIDLVRHLLKAGIDLRDYTCLWSRGSGFNCVSLWESIE